MKEKKKEIDVTYIFGDLVQHTVHGECENAYQKTEIMRCLSSWDKLEQHVKQYTSQLLSNIFKPPPEVINKTYS